MTIMSVAKFERLFRSAAKANARDVIEPFDLPRSRGLSSDYPLGLPLAQHSTATSAERRWRQQLVCLERGAAVQLL
jgi:hypothetical protein